MGPARGVAISARLLVRIRPERARQVGLHWLSQPGPNFFQEKDVGRADSEALPGLAALVVFQKRTTCLVLGGWKIRRADDSRTTHTQAESSNGDDSAEMPPVSRIRFPRTVKLGLRSRNILSFIMLGQKHLTGPWMHLTECRNPRCDRPWGHAWRRCTAVSRANRRPDRCRN